MINFPNGATVYNKTTLAVVDIIAGPCGFDGLNSDLEILDFAVSEGTTEITAQQAADNIPKIRQRRYEAEADPLKPEAEAELRLGRPEKYFAYTLIRLQIRRETEPAATQLALVKEDMSGYWKMVCDMMLECRYATPNRDAYKELKDKAKDAGLTNRQAYLEQLTTWGDQLFPLYYAAATSIQAASTVEDVLAVTIDFTTWIAADPEITYAGALAIPD